MASRPVGHAAAGAENLVWQRGGRALYTGVEDVLGCAGPRGLPPPLLHSSTTVPLCLGLPLWRPHPHPIRLLVSPSHHLCLCHPIPTCSPPPCPQCPPSLPPEFHYVNRDRHTVVRWDDFRPIFEKILSIGRDRDKYRALPYAQVKWDI